MFDCRAHPDIFQFPAFIPIPLFFPSHGCYSRLNCFPVCTVVHAYWFTRCGLLTPGDAVRLD
jgi:hypothetical protein